MLSTIDAMDEVMTTFFTVGAYALIAFNIPCHMLSNVDIPLVTKTLTNRPVESGVQQLCFDILDGEVKLFSHQKLESIIGVQTSYRRSSVYHDLERRF